MRTPSTSATRERAEAGACRSTRLVVTTSTLCPRATSRSVSSRATQMGPPKATAGHHAGLAKRIRSLLADIGRLDVSLHEDGDGERRRPQEAAARPQSVLLARCRGDRAAPR